MSDSRQMPLFSIRRQPARDALKLSNQTIRAYVREKLRDFPQRQAAREEKRKPKPKTEPAQMNLLPTETE